MGGQVINLLVIIAFGVILAELVTSKGTPALINGIAGMWQTSVNGMLGAPTAAAKVQTD